MARELLATSADKALRYEPLVSLIECRFEVRNAMRIAERWRRRRRWETVQRQIATLQKVAADLHDQDAVDHVTGAIDVLRRRYPRPRQSPKPLTDKQVQHIVVKKVHKGVETAMLARGRYTRRRGEAVHDTQPTSVAISRCTGLLVRRWFPDLCSRVTNEQIRKRMEYVPTSGKS